MTRHQVCLNLTLPFQAIGLISMLCEHCRQQAMSCMLLTTAAAAASLPASACRDLILQ